MEKFKNLSLLLLVVICLLTSIEACKKKDPEQPQPPKEKSAVFSGSIWSTKKEPIADATIEVNGKETKSGQKGEFEIKLDSAARYVLTVKKQGYGITSKVFLSPVQDKKYTLQQAFTVTVSPRNPIRVRDLRSSNNCSGTSLKDLDWGNEAYKKIPLVYNADGKLVDFGWSSPDLKAAFDYLSGTPVCNPGIQLNIPVGLIVDQNNNPVTDSVTLSLTTIDVFSDDGMPGDYTYRDRNGKENGFMISLGAASVEIYSKEGKKYNLDPKSEKKAELIIPIEPIQQKFIKDFPASIPLMYYDEKEGSWFQEGEAKLDKKTKSYIAQVSHFSTINMDYKMPDPACIKFRQNFVTGTAINPFQLATVTASGGLKYATSQGNEAANTCLYNGTTNLHLLYAVPKDAEICLVMLDPNGTSSPTDDIPYGIRIHRTRNETYAPNPPPTTCPYPICNSSATCFDNTTMTCTDLDCTDVYSFAGGSCSYLPITKFAEDVIGTAKKAGADANSKWIFKTPPANGASYNFSIAQLDGAGNPVGTATTGSKVYQTANPVQSHLVPALDPTAQKIQITANAIVSAEIEILP